MQTPTRILRLPDVLNRIGLKRTAFYDRVKRGEFPPPIQLGPNSVGWTEGDVEAWITERIAASRGEAA